MKKQTLLAAFIGVWSLATFSPVVHAQEAAPRLISLEEMLKLSEKNNPYLESSKELETAEQKSVDLAKTGYMPYVHLDAIDSTGFPGSTGQLGIAGLAGSPYRSGAAADIVVNQTIWDFGRTGWAVEAAKHSTESQKYTTQVNRIDTDLGAAQDYFACIRYRDQLESWRFMLDEAKLVAQEVKKFVSTGQRSVVERYLVDAQVDEATTSIADYQERINLALRRISLLTRLDPRSIQCPTSDHLGKVSVQSPKMGSADSPRVLAVSEQTESLRAKTKQASAARNPKLFALASVGMMEKSRLVPKQDYALGVGLTIPLFDSGRVSAEVDRASALAAAKDFQAQGERERVDYINAKYDEVIQGEKVRLQHLAHEVELGEKAFRLAKSRYLALQGSLVDVREALRNLVRSKTSMAEANSQFMEAVYAKAIFNGWKPSS
jgi:outer membrane protein TolC